MHRATARILSRTTALATLSLVTLAMAGCADRPNDPISPARPAAVRPGLAVSTDPGSWATKAPAPTARVGSVAGVIGGKLYVAGGCCISDVSPNPGLPALEVYDPEADSWTTKAPMPMAVWGGYAVGVIDDKLYVAGGVAVIPLLPPTTQVYDPATDTWAMKAPMPEPAFAVASGVIGGKLYVVGSTGFTPYGTLRVYDPVANTWAIKASLPGAAAHMSAGVVDGKLYVAGGVLGTSCPTPDCTILRSLRVYDPASDTWDTMLAPMPTPRFDFTFSVLNGRLHAIGGDLSYGVVTANHEVYDPATDSWTTDTPMPTARSAPAGVIDGRIYVAGGRKSGFYVTRQTDVLEVYTPAPAGTADQSIAFGALADRAFGDPPFDVNATASSGLPVSFTASGNCTVAGATATITGAGNCTVTASQAGSTTYNPATPVPRSFSIAPANQSALSVTGPATATYGSAAQLTTSGGSGPGAVTYTAASSTACSVDPLTGVVTITRGHGTCEVSATKAGGVDYSPATSPVLSILVRPARQTISMGPFGNKTFGDPPFALNATATSGLPLSVSSSSICPRASETMLMITGAGSCIVEAEQGGDVNYDPAPPVMLTFTIAKATPVIVWPAPASMIFGEPLGGGQFNAIATGVGGFSLPGSFAYSPPAGTVLNPGEHSLTVNFAPDDGVNYNSASKSVVVAVLYNTTVGHAFLPPIALPPDAPRVFKAGSTIPVKFQLFLADGVTPVSTAVATIQVAKISSGVPDGVPVEVLSTVANEGTNFRYDAAAQQYVFNLGTRNWTAGSYQITVSLDDGSQIKAVVGAR